MVDLVPEEAIEAASSAIAGVIFSRRFADSSNKHIDLAASALAAAAPLIVAAYRKALLADAFPDDDSDYHYGCERLLDLVRDGIPPALGVREDGD